jgi:hypothetical protein
MEQRESFWSKTLWASSPEFQQQDLLLLGTVQGVIAGQAIGYFAAAAVGVAVGYLLYECLSTINALLDVDVESCGGRPDALTMASAIAHPGVSTVPDRG